MGGLYQSTWRFFGHSHSVVCLLYTLGALFDAFHLGQAACGCHSSGFSYRLPMTRRKALSLSDPPPLGPRDLRSSRPLSKAGAIKPFTLEGLWLGGALPSSARSELRGQQKTVPCYLTSCKGKHSNHALKAECGGLFFTTVSVRHFLPPPPHD